MPVRLVLDTNALLMPFESGVRLEAELERLFGTYVALVPEAVRHELEAMAKTGQGARAQAARLARVLADRFPPIPTPGSGDDAILAAARREGAYLVTNDKALLKRALGAGLGVVRLKGKSHLVLETRQGEVR